MTSIAAGAAVSSSSSSSPSSTSSTTSSSSSPFSSSSNRNGQNASLTATVLSAYDLPLNNTNSTTNSSRRNSGTAATPSFVSVSIRNNNAESNDEDRSNNPIMMGRTGPPLAKHRDGNSFRFQGSGSSNETASSSSSSDSNNNNKKSNEVVFNAPLSTVYPSTVTFRVTFENNNNNDLIGHVNLKKELRVNEPKWLVLHLSPVASSSSHCSATAVTVSQGTPASPTPAAAQQQQEEEEENNASTPTLRVRLLLTGPYRPEISTLLSMGSSWFTIVDSTQSNLSSALATLPAKDVLYHKLGGKYLVIPAIPIAASLVVLTPILTGILLVGLPFFLPLLAVITTFASALSAICAMLYFSTKEGRERLGQTVVYPLLNAVLHTPAGQRLIYDVGPRPTPKSLAQTILPTDIWSKLVVSLVIDFIGSSSYLIPVAGEALDISWAPIQTILIAAMYDDVSPNLKYISFVEEILPLTDVIPSATLGWTREFGPALWMEGMGKVRDVTMVVQRERDALRSM